VSIPPNIYVAVIDDDASLCRSMARLLRVIGMHAVIYPSAEAFLADTKRPEFDCLLLDVELNGITGLELHERLAAVGSTTPVIFLTAHDDPEVRERALRAHCAAYLRKFEPADTVINCIRSVLKTSNPTLS
jgi:FixJ family two-component response regulator